MNRAKTLAVVAVVAVAVATLAGCADSEYRNTLAALTCDAWQRCDTTGAFDWAECFDHETSGGKIGGSACYVAPETERDCIALAGQVLSTAGCADGSAAGIAAAEWEVYQAGCYPGVYGETCR